MRLGLVGYTNKASGIGMFTWEFFRYLEADSILSVHSVKGQEVWTERQVTTTRPPPGEAMERYFRAFRPDVVLFLETPFAAGLFQVAKRHGARVVAVPMHETISSGRLNKADLMICTCKEAWRKSTHGNARLMFLPIGLEEFPYRERTGHTFVTNIGYGGVHDRRQTAKVIQAFRKVPDRRARLTLRCQQGWPKGMPQPGDERITYIVHNYEKPSDIYEEGDISILPIAYGGYERTILESMASGMPVLTVDADPMNTYQHDERFLVKPHRTWTLTDKWVTNTTYNEVSVGALRDKMLWLLSIDTAKFSRAARMQAEAQSWESEDIDYKGRWLEALSC